MYKTKQKDCMIEYFDKNPNKQYSAKEIAETLCSENRIGKSTVYRLIDKMVNEGTLKRFRGENAKSVLYQYVGIDNVCNSHFHLKCTNCGLLIHLKCDSMNEIKEHIKLHHNFAVDTSKTIMYGVCNKCSGEVFNEKGN